MTIKRSSLSWTAVALSAAAVVAVPATASRVRIAGNHHCCNEQALYRSKAVVIARETTETSDIYVTCWRTSNKRRVVAKFPAEDQQEIAFRARGAWVV